MFCLAANTNAPHNTPMLGVHAHGAAGRAAFGNNDVRRGPVNVDVITLNGKSLLTNKLRLQRLGQRRCVKYLLVCFRRHLETAKKAPDY